MEETNGISTGVRIMAGDINKSVNVAINVINGVSKQVGAIVGSIGKIGDAANKAIKSVSGLDKQLGRLKSPAGIKTLGSDLGTLSKVDAKGVEKLADGIKKLSKSKLPSFSKINTELATHTKRVNDLVSAYNRLQKASSKVNLKAFTANAKSANKQVNTLGKSSKKTSTSFSQWGYALGSASTGLSKFGTQIYGVTRGFSAVSKEMGIAMAAFTAGFATLFALKGVVSDIAEFDDAIRSAGAVAQASSVQLTQLSDASRAMGESTRYTAKDAAEALKALAMTGLDVNESIATLPTVLNLAAAANMDLGKSADIVTNIMVGYGKTISDLPRIADLMTAAFTNSNTSLEEIGVALKYVGPVARAAGQSLEETTGILASLANAGYRGSKAGTTLRTAFSRLLAPTDKMTKVLDHYGIVLSDLTNENGTMQSFTDILDLMGEKSITAGDALTIFGKRAGPGILSLIAQGTPAIEEMNRKIAESEGTALKAAYEMEAGLGGALRRLKSMWEEVSIAIGKTIEQDVQGFVKALTKSLKENKEQIVAVVSALFNFVGVLAKVVGWMTQFATEHFKLLGALAAITVAMKLLSLTSKEFMAIGIVKYFSTMFTSVKWSGIATGLGAVSTQLNSYSKAAKGATAANAGQSISQLSAINFASIATGIKNIASTLLTLGINTGRAIAAFLAANPVILGLTVAIGGLLAITKILDNNYQAAADSALKVASASKEANRELSYQLAELGLINKEFERGNSEDFSNAEERLRDVLKLSNISIEDKIRLLKMSRESSESAQEAVAELTETIEKEKKALDAKEISKTTEARIAQSNAVEEQAKNLEYYYDIQIDGKTRLNALEKVAAATNTIAPILWLKKKLGYLDDNIDKYEELKSQQSVMEGNYQSMIAQMISAGKSAEDFNDALQESGASSSEIDSLTTSYSKLKDEAEANKDVMDDLRRLSKAAIDELEKEGRTKLETFKANSKEREAIEKQTLYNISALEAKGTINHETAEMAKLQATLDFAQDRIDSAKETYNSIDDLARESRSSAMDEIIAAEEAAASARLRILQKLSTAEHALNDKLVKLSDKRITETSKNEQKLSDLQTKLNDKRLDAKIAKTDKIKEIEIKLSDKLKEIEENLAAKRKKLAQDRVDAIRSSIQKIQDIESSTEDKLRSIRQRGMSDSEKDASNREAAISKLGEGQRLVAVARATGDAAALERGIKLIEQSSDLSSGLDSERNATDGVKDASNALKDAEGVRVKIALQDIAKKVKAEKDAAAKAKKIAEDAASADKGKAEDSYNKKIKAAEKFYTEEKAKENNRHSNVILNINKEIQKYSDKINLIEKEKQLVIDLIDQHRTLSSLESGSDVWTEANRATDEAIEKVEEYSNAVKGINDKEVNIKFTGEASPKQGLGDTLKDIKSKFAEISTDIEVNVRFVIGTKSLSDGLDDVKNEIESIDIDIPVSVSMDKLVEATKLIDEYRKKEIKVTVKVDSGQLNTVSRIFKNMKDKTVKLTMKVIGYDNLVKAKNMLDSIRSKTVTVTTKHVDVKAKASGGYIEPEAYAKGGDVFRRLGSRFIGSGSGKKDDVPAMLMKGEFVQKVSAVKKYGKDFMSRLNAGLIPSTITRMFNQGGDVQPEHYASGGHVGYGSLMSRMRKKHEERMLERRDKAAGAMNFNINNNINGMGGMTPFGLDAIGSLKSVLQDSISAFAIGGSTIDSNNITNISRSLNSDYNKKINAAKAVGDTALAAILQKEQKEIAELSKKLTEDLRELETDYKKFKEESTAEHVKRIDEIKKSYTENITGLDDSNIESMQEIKETYLDRVASIDESELDNDKAYKDAIDQYNEEKDALKAEKESAKIDNAFAYKDSIDSGHDLGKQIHMLLGTKNVNHAREMRTKSDNMRSKSNGPGMGSPTGRAHAGSFTLDEILNQYKQMDGSGYMGIGNPDFQSMKRMLGEAFPELKNFLTGRPDTAGTAFGEPTKIKTSSKIVGAAKPVDLEEIGENEVAADGASQKERVAITERNEAKQRERDVNKGSMGTISVSYMTAKDGMELAKQIFSIEKSFNESKPSAFTKLYDDKLKEIIESENETKETYKKDSDYIKNERSENNAEYESSNLKEMEDYNKQKKEYNDTYKNYTNEENSLYTSAIKEAGDAYKKEVAVLKSEYTSNKKVISDATSEEVGVQKQTTTSDIAELKSTLEEELKKLGISTNQSSDLTSFFKDFKIRGFNTGGHVSPTTTSVPGKDSILSALTPNEYVMKASVVRRFGKGFFDSLNNFQIPHFNTGGIVGGNDSSLLGDMASTVRHTLDLSINGNRQGELTGSPITIENILNDLTLAKMRA